MAEILHDLCLDSEVPPAQRRFERKKMSRYTWICRFVDTHGQEYGTNYVQLYDVRLLMRMHKNAIRSTIRTYIHSWFFLCRVAPAG